MTDLEKSIVEEEQARLPSCENRLKKRLVYYPIGFNLGICYTAELYMDIYACPKNAFSLSPLLKIKIFILESPNFSAHAQAGIVPGISVENKMRLITVRTIRLL